jgi:hypothetical protein
LERIINGVGIVFEPLEMSLPWPGISILQNAGKTDSPSFYFWKHASGPLGKAR